ncbi:hypothetical protein J3F84DRAFT_358984, partial [Trichoderma pleuroticola]
MSQSAASSRWFILGTVSVQPCVLLSSCLCALKRMNLSCMLPFLPIFALFLTNVPFCPFSLDDANVYSPS